MNVVVYVVTAFIVLFGIGSTWLSYKEDKDRKADRERKGSDGTEEK